MTHHGSLGHTMTNLIILVFTNRLVGRIYETKFPTHVSFFYSTFFFSVTLNFPSTLKNFLFVRHCSHVTILPA